MFRHILFTIPIFSSGSENLIKLDGRYAKSQATKNQDFRFDSVLTGSDNRTIYNRAARAHVRAAMEGYNSLVFAYGQTASGKTFTLMGNQYRSYRMPCAPPPI